MDSQIQDEKKVWVQSTGFKSADLNQHYFLRRVLETGQIWYLQKQCSYR